MQLTSVFFESMVYRSGFLLPIACCQTKQARTVKHPGLKKNFNTIVRPPPLVECHRRADNKLWKTWTLSGLTREVMTAAARTLGRAGGSLRQKWPTTSCTRALGAPPSVEMDAGRAWSLWRRSTTIDTTVPSGEMKYNRRLA